MVRIARLVARDRRRERAARDIEVLLAERSVYRRDELDDFVARASQTHLELD